MRWWIDVKSNVLGIPYPQYIFSDSQDSDMYVHEYDVVKLLPPTVDFKMTDSVDFALDVSKMFFVKRMFLIRMASMGDYKFRTRRLLEYPKK